MMTTTTMMAVGLLEVGHGQAVEEIIKDALLIQLTIGQTLQTIEQTRQTTRQTHLITGQT